jgi:hypothetical protein
VTRDDFIKQIEAEGFVGSNHTDFWIKRTPGTIHYETWVVDMREARHYDANSIYVDKKEKLDSAEVKRD